MLRGCRDGARSENLRGGVLMWLCGPISANLHQWIGDSFHFCISSLAQYLQTINNGLMMVCSYCDPITSNNHQWMDDDGNPNNQSMVCNNCKPSSPLMMVCCYCIDCVFLSNLASIYWGPITVIIINGWSIFFAANIHRLATGVIAEFNNRSPESFFQKGAFTYYVY